MNRGCIGNGNGLALSNDESFLMALTRDQVAVANNNQVLQVGTKSGLIVYQFPVITVKVKGVRVSPDDKWVLINCDGEGTATTSFVLLNL